MCISRAVVRPRRDGVLHPVLDVGRVDVVHRFHLPALIVCVKGGEYSLLESEYRLFRDLQRGKQLSEKQIAQLRVDAETSLFCRWNVSLGLPAL